MEKGEKMNYDTLIKGIQKNIKKQVKGNPKFEIIDNGNSMYIINKESKKFYECPLYAYQEVMKALEAFL